MDYAYYCIIIIEGNYNIALRLNTCHLVSVLVRDSPHAANCLVYIVTFPLPLSFTKHTRISLSSFVLNIKITVPSRIVSFIHKPHLGELVASHLVATYFTHKGEGMAGIAFDGKHAWT